MDSNISSPVSSYKYNAFISYRHIEPDKSIAERLSRLLEGYKAPRALSGKHTLRNINRVFRDRDELPTSGDLGADIKEALRLSQCLIVICSPDTPKSKWCEKEIEIFRDLHPNGCILSLLIAGEPNESFPRALRFLSVDKINESGLQEKVTIEFEPLAADIRAESLSKSLRLLQNEKLRLLAPMLGCEYDELRQRHRERRLKRIIVATSIAAVAASAVGIVVLSLLISLRTANMKLVEKDNKILANNSSYLTDTAQKLFDRGARTKALLVELEALPKDLKNPERPLLPEAVNALAAMYNSNPPTSSLIETQGIPLDVQVSPDSRLLVTEEQEAYNQRSFHVWTMSGDYRATLQNVPPWYSYAWITADSRYVVIKDLYWNINSGELLGKYNQAGPVGAITNLADTGISPKGKFSVRYSSNDAQGIYLTDRQTGRVLELPHGNQPVLVFFADDSRLLVETQPEYQVNANPQTTIYDTATGQELYSALKPVHYNYLCTSPDLKWVALGESGDLVIFQTANMKEVARLKDKLAIYGTMWVFDTPRAQFSHDGSRLLFNLDATVQIWDWQKNELGDLPNEEPTTLMINNSLYDVFGDSQMLSWDDALVATVKDNDIRLSRMNLLKSVYDNDDLLYGLTRLSPPILGTLRAMWDNKAAPLSATDPDDHKSFALYRGHTDTMTSIKFTPDGKYVISSSKDKTVRIWVTDDTPHMDLYRYEKAFPYIWPDVTTRIGAGRTLGPTDETSQLSQYVHDALNLQPDDPLEALALRDSATGQEIAEIREAGGMIDKVLPVGDGSRFVTESGDHSITVWNASDGSKLKEITPGIAHAYTSDGSTVACIDDANDYIKIWSCDASDEPLLSQYLPDLGLDAWYSIIEGPTGKTQVYWFDGDRILGVLNRQKLYTFTVSGKKLSAKWPPIEISAVTGVDWTSLDNLIAVCGDTVYAGSNGTAEDQGHSVVTAYDMKTGNKLFSRKLDESMQAIAYENGTLLVGTRSIVNKTYDKLYALDPATGASLYEGEFDAALTDMHATSSAFFVSQVDGEIIGIDRADGKKTVFSLTLQMDKASVFCSISKDCSHIALRDEKNDKMYIFDRSKNCVIAQYWDINDIIFTDDLSGYVLVTPFVCGYVPFMNDEQTMMAVRQDLAADDVTLSPEEKRKYFIN